MALGGVLGWGPNPERVCVVVEFMGHEWWIKVWQSTNCLL